MTKFDRNLRVIASILLQNKRLEVPSPFDHIDGLNETRLNIDINEDTNNETADSL